MAIKQKPTHRQPITQMSEKTELSAEDVFAKHKKLVARSGLFDAEFYSKSYSFPAGSGPDLLDHYLTLGWRQGFDPNPHFSTSYYLAANPDIEQQAINPLLHYVLFGKAEGRSLVPPFVLSHNSGPPATARAPKESDWTRLLQTWQPHRAPIVDVIVPVYKGFDETLRCLFSVLDAQVKTPYRLIVVDDHSPDENLSEALRCLASIGLIELHETPLNQGFVAACNLGMQLHVDRDVVLLNSDTEVFNNWLDRLLNAALITLRVATVTPFSNNAEICSYPNFCKDTRGALEISDAELDALAAVVNAGVQVDLPTGVGFCMYVRRACLNDIGFFDFETFGSGYGEENDFCRRALRKGWRNILAPDVFVRHYGGTSFGASKLARVNKAVKLVETRHPGYLAEVGEFIRCDPIAPFRQALDIERLARRSKPKGGILFLNHARGGGTEKHMQDHAALLANDGLESIFCRPSPDGSPKIRVSGANHVDTPNLPEIDLRNDPKQFINLLKRIGVTHIHIQHLADFDERIDEFLLMVAEQGKINYDFSIHDYMPICPRINLVDWSGFYCGEPPLNVCGLCLKKTGFLPSSTSIVEWRERFEKILSKARRIFVPDQDVEHRLKRHLPQLRFEVKPHIDTISPASTKKTQTPPIASQTRTVVIIGAVGPHKGVRLLLECAHIALKTEANLKFVLLGFTDRDDEFEDLSNVTITGRYVDEDLQDRLTNLDADIAWFPAVWPETYSYTLSAALAANIFPLAFDFGAIASRLRAIGWGELMPLEMMLHPPRIVEFLSNIRLSQVRAPMKPELSQYDNPLYSYYGFQASRSVNP